MRKVPSDWEKDLWAIICSGNGIVCPLYENCQFTDDNALCKRNPVMMQGVNKLLDNDEIDTAIKDDIDNVDFGICLRGGLIFKKLIKLTKVILDDRWSGSLPVPDNLILQDYNNVPIEVRHLPLKTKHGAVWHLKNCWLIHLNSNDSFVRQRFTLYHEIFHILAHSQGSPQFKTRESDEANFNEILADHFSACLLLPQDILYKYWTKYEDIDTIAGIFKVPKSVLYISLKADRLL